MFWVILIISLVGFGYAAYKDLRTTEFPDWLPYSIITAAVIARGIYAYVLGDWWILLSAFLYGGIFFGIGYVLYMAKQWGDGDAWLLGSLGFLLSDPTGIYSEWNFAFTRFPFPAAVLFNFFFASFVYLLAYSISVGLANPRPLKAFFGGLRKDLGEIRNIVMVFTGACLAMFAALFYAGLPLWFLLTILYFPPLLITMLLFMRYARFIEDTMFRKRINVKYLKVGDVPSDEKWKVMDEKTLKKLRKRGGKIWIKEGVRFAPAFVITVLVTLFYGNVLSLFLI
jgi:hypothetical protein